jgi:secreted trypsin-like serine protease
MAQVDYLIVADIQRKGRQCKYSGNESDRSEKDRNHAPKFTGDFSLLLSNNAASGGTCFGDSGGPNFLGDSMIVAGVTSFGLNGNCAGTGGVFRIDRLNVLDFINSFIAGPYTPAP